MYLHEINKWRMSLDVKLWFTRWQSLAYITFDSGLYEDELYDCKDNDVPSDDYVDAGWTDNEDLYNNGELYNDGGQIAVYDYKGQLDDGDQYTVYNNDNPKDSLDDNDNTINK
jgi:hypothetical protein